MDVAIGCKMIADGVKALTNENAELRKRAMPEGYEWPCYEDREPVMFGDRVYHDDESAFFTVETVEIMQDGWYALASTNGLRDVYRPGERVRRPAVLAADGEPLEVGQTVWRVSNGIEFTVVGLPKSGEYQAVKLRLDDGAFTGLDPDQLTHQRPVLDADGVPIREGDKVWCVATDDEFEDMGILIGKDKVRQRLTVRGTLFNNGEPWVDFCETSYSVRACYLTHTKPEPPDSWERIEEDARLKPSEYTDRYRIGRIGFESEDMRADLVRRCRALAERGE